MNNEIYSRKSREYLELLCSKIPTRLVGKEGNRMATRFFAEQMKVFGFQMDMPEFDCMDWTGNGARLTISDKMLEIQPNTFTSGCQTRGELCPIRSVDELKTKTIKDKILILMDEIAVEQLMPKNFIFYNPDRHKEIIALLEAGQPKAIIGATGSNPMLAGGVYPFPLIEDGDFDIPNAMMKDIEGESVAKYAGQIAELTMDATRKTAKGYNVIAVKGELEQPRIVITAHIDAKIGTPGALDNASGISVLLLLAELLSDYSGKYRIEIVALNGEDFYSVPGQMLYYHANQNHWNDIFLNINIDGAGYNKGRTVFSTYNCSNELNDTIISVFGRTNGIIAGPEWFQSDHSIFIQQGCSAIALTSEMLLSDLTVNITHTPKDHPGIVNDLKLVEIAESLRNLIYILNR